MGFPPFTRDHFIVMIDSGASRATHRGPPQGEYYAKNTSTTRRCDLRYTLNVVIWCKFHMMYMVDLPGRRYHELSMIA